MHDLCIKLMQDATDKRRALEREHKECVARLQEKQRELQAKPSNYAEKTRLCEHIESLQVKSIVIGFFFFLRERVSYRSICIVIVVMHSSLRHGNWKKKWNWKTLNRRSYK